MTIVKDEKKFAEQIRELQKKEIPGKSTRFKVEYLMEHFPKFGAKEMAQVLGVTISAVYTAKHSVLKSKGKTKKMHSTTDKPKKEKAPAPKSQAPAPKLEYDVQQRKESKQLEYNIQQPAPQPAPQQHIDIWDQEQHLINSIDPVYPYDQQYIPEYIAPQQQQQQPVYVHVPPIAPPQTLQRQGSTFEICTSGVDGITTKSLISVLYGKISDSRNYKVQIKIVEE